VVGVVSLCDVCGSCCVVSCFRVATIFKRERKKREKETVELTGYMVSCSAVHQSRSMRCGLAWLAGRECIVVVAVDDVVCFVC